MKHFVDSIYKSPHLTHILGLVKCKIGNSVFDKREIIKDEAHPSYKLIPTVDFKLCLVNERKKMESIT